MRWDCPVVDMTTDGFLERVTSIARLYDLRASATRWLIDAGVAVEAIEAVVLVLSETCTNAFTHGRADGVDVEMTIDNVDHSGAKITMWMCHDDHDASALSVPTTMPPPQAQFGRGLALVERLVDGMTLSIDPPRVVRQCWLRADGTAGG